MLVFLGAWDGTFLLGAWFTDGLEVAVFGVFRTLLPLFTVLRDGELGLSTVLGLAIC